MYEAICKLKYIQILDKKTNVTRNTHNPFTLNIMKKDIFKMNFFSFK